MPGRQLLICTPLQASDAMIERKNYMRGTSIDLFISELWMLLDTNHSTTDHFVSLPIGQDSRRQDRIKQAMY